MRPLRVGIVTLAMVASVWGQARVVRASGDAVISVKPDLVKIDIGVVTVADTAQSAAAQNASQTDALLARLKQALGTSGDTRTVAYSITPNYRSGTTQPPAIISFTASNTLEISISDLASIGTVIDVASQAGANSIGGLHLAVKDDVPVRAQALTAAAKQARANAQAIAAGVGGQLGMVRAAQQGSTITPVGMQNAAPTATTPIEPGLVQVSATVAIEVELI